MKTRCWIMAFVAMLVCVVVDSTWAKTVTLVPLSIDRVITLADNQVDGAFEFRLQSDDTVSLDAVYLNLSVVEGTTEPGDRFVRSLLLFDDTGRLVAEAVLKGEVVGDFRMKICQTLLANVPRTYYVVVHGGYAGYDRSNTIRLNLAFSWLECDADVTMADFPRADVILGYYSGQKHLLTVRRSNDIVSGVVHANKRYGLASFLFETTEETKVIHNPTFEIEANGNIWGIKHLTLSRIDGTRLAYGTTMPIENCSRLLVVFPCTIEVPPGGITLKVLGKPTKLFHGKFAISARVSEMFPVGVATGIQSRARGDGCLVTGPTMRKP